MRTEVTENSSLAQQNEKLTQKVAELNKRVRTLEWELTDAEDRVDYWSGYCDIEDSISYSKLRGAALELVDCLRGPAFIDDLCGPVLTRTTRMDQLYRALCSVKEIVEIDKQKV